MYLKPTNKHWIIDVEADDLDAKVVWVVCVQNAVTKEKQRLIGYETIRAWFEARQKEGCFFVGHNIIGFDAPTLNRLVRTKLPISRLVDTFVLSMLYSPSLDGGHSLEAWGERVGKGKVLFCDFSRYSEELVLRCEQDVEINVTVFNRLTYRMREVGISERNAEIEHKAWNIIRKQKNNGFWFDIEKAHVLFAELRKEEEEIKREIYHQFPPQLQLIKTYKKPFKKNGDPTADYTRHLATFPQVTIRGDVYDVYDWVEFNLGSPPQRVKKLLELGWVPLADEYTKPSKTHPKGQPSPTRKGDLVPSLAAFAEEAGIKEVKLIAEWIAVNSRANMVGNWLDLYNEKTGCIHGNLWLANTLRYRHDKPNTANIPAVRNRKTEQGSMVLRGRQGLWTYEARDLWTVRDKRDRVLVGVDATGIQFRVLAHYLNDPEFTEIVLGGDIHEYNRGKTGHGSREQNKTFGYAALLGAGAAKVGQIFAVGEQEGGKIKNNWIKGVPGLDSLYKRLKGELKRTGRITLCDGGRVLVSSPHMVLAYLLQGDESRIMKQAMIYVDEEVRKSGLDILKVGDIHDEWQSDCDKRHVERYSEICHDAFKRAGEAFCYNLPITCGIKEGLTWAETH